MVMKMLNKNQRLFYALAGLKTIIGDYEFETKVKDNETGEVDIVDCYKEIETLILELINPQPYKFEDLKELIGKPIFDYKYKEFYILAEVKEEELYKDEGLEKFMICSDKKGLMRVFFEEGRFFPVTKAMEYQEWELKKN